MVKIVELYEWLKHNPEDAKRLYAVVGSRDITAVVRKLEENYKGSLVGSISYLLNNKPTQQFPYRRRFVSKLKETLLKNTITFLVGPRKCGKTVGLHQLCAELPDVRYYSGKEQSDIIMEVENALNHNTPIIYLLDEFTYFDTPDFVIARLGNLMAEYNVTATHIVVAGGSSRALEYWSHTYFAGDCGIVRADFMSFTEWLEYREIPCTAESYIDYLCNVDEFCHLSNVREYLDSCLSETEVSNQKSATIIMRNETCNLTTDILMDVILATFICLHNRTDRLPETANKYYSTFKAMGEDVLADALWFLHCCGLITITSVLSRLSYANPLSMLKIGNMISTDKVFKNVNITIRHPVLFSSIIKHVLNIDYIDSLNSMIECHARGVLPTHSSLEYHDVTNNDAEIDYVNINEKLAIELTIRDKHKNNFDILPKDYKTIMLSRDNYFIYLRDWELQYKL